MSEYHAPWLTLAILTPALGGLWVARLPGPERARRVSLVISALSLVWACCAWADFAILDATAAHDPWDVAAAASRPAFFVVDSLSAPLLPLVALLYFLTQLATTRGKARRFSFAWALFAQATTLATFSCVSPWGIITFLSIGTVPPWLELRSRQKPTRVVTLYMGLFVALLLAGWTLASGGVGHWRSLGHGCLVAAVLIRSGAVPLHGWMTELFQHATFGNSLLFVTPMVGAYAAVRLVLPIAPEVALQTISGFALATAVYAAGMSLVQRDARRFFCYQFLSHSSLVLIGLQTTNELGLVASLLAWISVSISLTGFGLTLRSVEARTGRLLLTEYRGLADHMPQLAACFLLSGLASVGFPGTSGFIASELLVEAAAERSAFYGIVVVLAAALNGIAVLQAYFRVFTGTRHQATISLRARPHEKFAVLTLFVLIIAGGLVPQPGVSSRYRAATGLLQQRERELHQNVPEKQSGRAPSKLGMHAP